MNFSNIIFIQKRNDAVFVVWLQPSRHTMDTPTFVVQVKLISRKWWSACGIFSSYICKQFEKQHVRYLCKTVKLIEICNIINFRLYIHTSIYVTQNIQKKKSKCPTTTTTKQGRKKTRKWTKFPLSHSVILRTRWAYIICDKDKKKLYAKWLYEKWIWK